MDIRFKLIHPGAQLPKQATEGSGGFDFFAPEGGCLDPHEKRLIASGVAHDLPGKFLLQYRDEHFVHIELPVKLQGILFDRSGLGAKKGIRLSFAGLIDNDYRGEIKLSLENDSELPFFWKAGERLCQIAYVPMIVANSVQALELTETERGAGGFGSTGK